MPGDHLGNTHPFTFVLAKIFTLLVQNNQGFGPRGDSLKKLGTHVSRVVVVGLSGSFEGSPQ